MPLGVTQDGKQVPSTSEESVKQSSRIFQTDNSMAEAGPSIKVSGASEYDMENKQSRADDLKSDDEFHTASECTLRNSRSPTYDSASECEARYSPWWEYDKNLNEDVSKEKMVSAVGCPQLPPPEEVSKPSPSVPPGKIVHEVIETTHIRVQHSHTLGVKSFVLSSETVRDTKAQGFDAAPEKTAVFNNVAVKEEEDIHDGGLSKRLEECGNWLQLKILEITPESTKLGATLAEALELQKAHDEVLRQLQNKQSPVEELLRQADQLIATQKPRAEVYAAMAETLGRAWRDINYNLELRKHISDLNVQYHTKAAEFFDRIKSLEESCTDRIVPIEIETVKQFLTTIHDSRRTLSESSMAALQAGNSLLGKLKALGADGTLDSRPDNIRQSIDKALSQVQSWLDELHVKRQDVEAIFNKRKLQLEQCLALAILAADLRELEDYVSNCRNRLANADQLGDSAASTELLLHENKKLLPEAQISQEKSSKITKATEQSLASGCFAGEDATKQSYAILSLTSDYMTESQNRNSLLERVMSFFKSSQAAFNNLGQLEHQSTSSNLKPTSHELTHLHAQCSKAIEEITAGPIAEGHSILQSVGRGSTGTDGIKRTVEDLENIKIRSDALCLAHREESSRINRASDDFFETYSSIQTWSSSIAEAFLQSHQSMGSDLVTANDFMDLHRKSLIDLQDKGNEINSLLLTLLPPIVQYSDDERRKDVDRKVEELHERWTHLKNISKNRSDLGKIYVKFHTEADIVNREIDKSEDELRSKGTSIDDESSKSLEIKWESLEPSYHSAKNTGLTFINDAKKVSEPHLDTNRACACVEAVLEKSSGRQLQVTRTWQTIQADVTEKRELSIKLEETIMESTKTINWVTKLEAQLYPVITITSEHPNDIADSLRTKLETVLPDIKRAQNEVEQKINTAEASIAKTKTTDEKAFTVKNRSSELNRKSIDITTDYQSLVQNLISYFINSQDFQNDVQKINDRQKNTSDITNINEIKFRIAEYESSVQMINPKLNQSLGNCDSITREILRKEPPSAASHDIEKSRRTLEVNRSTWEMQSQQIRETSDKQYTFCQFDDDLSNINRSINNLEKQNQESKNKHGKSIDEARASSLAYADFEKTIQDLDKKISDFISYGERLMLENHSHSPIIEKHIRELQSRWSDFKNQIQITRHLINLSIQYFQLIQEADQWFKEGNRLLVSIARRSTLVKRPEEAEELLEEITTFLRPGEEKQNERIRRITESAEEIYGRELPTQLNHVSDESREMIKSFSIIREELDTLSRNSTKAEQEKLRLQKEQEEAAAKLAAARAEALALEEARAAAARERLALEEAKRIELERSEKQRLAALEAERERRALEAEKERLALEAERERQALEAERERRALEAERERRALEAEKERLALEAERERQALEAERERRALEAERERRALEAEKEAKRIESEISEKQRIEAEREREKEERALQERIKQLKEEEFRSQTIREVHSVQKSYSSESTKEIIELPRFITPLTDAVIEEGSKFSFVCQVTGIPTPAISWYKAGVPIQNNPDYQTSYDKGICTLTIEETFSDDSARYTCKATNSGGIAETSAFLSVKETEPQEQLIPPSFVKSLEPACVKEGSSFEFHCKVEGNPSPNVQWYKNQECVDYAPGYHITYNNGDAFLKIEVVEFKDKAEYTCKASNQLGSAQSTANLIVTPMVPTQPPTMILPLSNVMARAGQKIKLECEVTGLPQPDIVWFQNGFPLKETRESKIQREGDRATLVIYEAFPKDAGNYKVTATNLAGEASSVCSVSVKGRLPNETSDSEIASDMEPVKPSIQLPSNDVTINEGSRVRLDCVIIGQPEPEVIWYHDGRPVKESTDFQSLFQGDRCSLVIQEAFSEDAGEYKVVALNSAGEASSKCCLFVKPTSTTSATDSGTEKNIPVGYPPKFNTLSTDILVSEGEQVKFEGNVSGQPRPDIKWLLNNLPITSNENVKVSHDEEGTIRLEIKEVQPQDKGVYTVKATNEHGEAKCFAQLIVKSSRVPETVKYEEVKSAPMFTDLFNDKTAFENTSTKFECIVTGKPKPKVKWLFRGEPINGANFSVSTSGDRQVLSIPNITKDTEGTITCIAENEIGTASCAAQLAVHSLSTITLPDQSNLSHFMDSSFSMKREVHTESSTKMSSSVTSSGVDLPEPQTKIHSFSSHSEKTFRQVNQESPEISESHNVEEFLKLDNKQPIIHEKSSSTFSNIKSDVKSIQPSFKTVSKTRAPKFTTPVIGKIVDQNTTVISEGIVDGSPTPSVVWTKNGKDITFSDKISAQWEFNKASLEIKDTNSSDAGRYTCTAMNDAGTAISTADLVVRKTIFPPVFGRRLQAQVIKKGDRIVMEVEVTGTPEPTITWFKDSVPVEQALTDNYRIKSFGSSHTSVIEKADLKHSGRFMVRALNSGGEAQSIADIAVFEPTPDTMVEVVKTVVFEDVRKHETSTSAADRISSPTTTKTIEKPFSPAPLHIPESKTSTFESSVSSTSKSEFSTFTEQKVSQQVSTARLEYNAPDIPQMKPSHTEFLDQKMDFEIVDAPPEPDSHSKTLQDTEEGIQTSSISKESSSQYFVKKIEESKEKEVPVVDNVVNYKKFERVEKEEKQGIKEPLLMTLQPEKVSHLTEEKTTVFQQQTIDDFQLKPEPPATIFYSEPVSDKKEHISTIPIVEEKEKEVIKFPSYIAPEPTPSVTKIEERVPIDSQTYEEKVDVSHDFSIKTHYEKFTRGVSPRPEALEMEKSWIPKKEFERPSSVTETIVSSKPSHVRSYSYSEREYSTETPRIHYVANVSHCIEPCEKKIENLLTTTEKYEKFEQIGTKNEFIIEEQNVKPSQSSKEWKPVKVQPPSFKSYPTMENLSIRPASVQEITHEVFLEPGPPPVIDYAEPPKARRQSHVETIEHELETKLETVPAKVPPGGVRTIPPPPPPKVMPPPLPPKNEQPIAPPLPAKPFRTEFKEKIVEIKPKEVNSEPFPFKPEPAKPKLMKVGPPPTPSKFIKGRFTDSDYESDFESVRIQPKWKPCASDNEEPAYRKVRPPKSQETKRSRSTEPEPLPPSKFDHPPQFQGPPRPEVKVEHQKRVTQSIQKTNLQKISKPQEIISSPPIKPGTPPLYIEAPPKKIDSPKTKRRTFNDGYMADTDEPFFQQKSCKSETHEVGDNFSRYEYKSENSVQSSQTCMSSTPAPKISHPKKFSPHAPVAKKELTATPIITNVSTEKRDESYEIKRKTEHHSRLQQQRTKTLKCPPPPSPSKFVRGEFRESDYESDYDKPIPKIWKPTGTEDATNFRPVRPVLTPTGRTPQVVKTPTPPTQFEEPLKTAGPPRPKFEPIDKPLVSSIPVEITKPEAVFKPKAVPATQTTDITRFIPLRPGTPPEMAYASSPQAVQYYRSTTSMPYHNAVQTETSNKVHFKESSEKCHRTVSVEQSTKVIKFGEKQTGVKIEPYSETKRTVLRGPPPTTPKRFTPGEFRESDYESDVDNVKIKPKWAPCGSDTEDLHYRPVRPPSSASRSSSVPPNKERVVTPMEFDKYPYKSVDKTDSETKRIESSSHHRYSTNSNLLATRSRSYEPPVKRLEIQPGSPPEYGFISDSKFKSKASSIASHHMDNMTQEFKSKTQKFVRDIMNDVDQKATPKKSISKNGEDRDAQVYREETRAAQYGTKHVDPDTGLIYFKYDFGYEFGIVLPGESKNGGIPERPKTIIEPPKRTRDIEMPVYHETSPQTKSSQHVKPKTPKTNRNIKWEPTSESELSEYEGNARRSQGSEKHRMTDTPPSCPDTPVNANKGPSGPAKAPMFITPSRNIAVVSGQNAKFECIVQSEPPPTVLWSKNGRIIEDSNDYQLHSRNGVCRLTISRAYPEDAGTYTCTATNVAGTASTTAILDVPGELKSVYIK